MYTINPELTIYQNLVNAGVPIKNHCSDLYCPVTEETKAMMQAYNLQPTMFLSPVDGKHWYDLHFAYEPYWEQRLAAKG